MVDRTYEYINKIRVNKFIIFNNLYQCFIMMTLNVLLKSDACVYSPPFLAANRIWNRRVQHKKCFEKSHEITILNPLKKR